MSYNSIFVDDIVSAVAVERKAHMDNVHLSLRAFGGPLYVVFSHVDVPVGKFAQYHRIAHIRADGLFINPARNNWYQDGVTGFADSLDDLGLALEEISQRTGRKLCFVGHSMGAYCALIMAGRIANSTYLATSPELRLNVPGSRSAQSKVNLVGKSPSYTSIPRITRSKGLVLFGNYDPMDCFFLASNSIQNGELGQVGVLNYHHGVTEYLTKDNSYAEILQCAGSGEFQLDQMPNVNTLNQAGTPEQLLAFYRAYHLSKVCWPWFGISRIRALKTLQQIEKWKNPGCWNLQSNLYSSFGATSKAFQFAQKAAEKAPHVYEYVVHYGQLAMKIGSNMDVKRSLQLGRQSELHHQIFNEFHEQAKIYLKINS